MSTLAHQWEGDPVALHLRSRYRDPSTPVQRHETLHYEAWLEVDGIRVSYLALIGSARNNEPLYIQMIETRLEYRRQGWAVRLIQETASYIRRPLRSYGQYTPDGFAALRGKVKLADGKAMPTEPEVHQQSFIADWEGEKGPVKVQWGLNPPPEEF